MAPLINLKRFSDWFWGAAIPFWTARAADAAGGFHESLDQDGRPNAGAIRRVRVQWRQVHVFATLARLKRAPEALDLARAGFDWAVARAAAGEGAAGCAHLLAPDGSTLDARRELYDQAFFLLATASLGRAGGASRSFSVAARVKAFLDERLRSPSGGYLEDDRASLPRRQNPHMHLFEAFLALHEATGDLVWRQAAADIHALFEARFLDPSTGLLRENFDAGLRPLQDSGGELYEPGHMAEWVWLLERWGAAGVGRRQRRLLEAAVAIGRDAASGFLVNCATATGATDGRRRLWPQTEYLKALLVMARKGEAGAAESADALAAAMLSTYLAARREGLWIDEFDAAGRPVAEAVPASILYHLLEAALETDAYLGEKGA